MFPVPLSTIPAWRASGDELKRAIGQKNAHRKALKEEYRALKKAHPEEFAHRLKRTVISDPETVQLGQEINTQRETAKADERRQASQQRLIREQEQLYGLKPVNSPRIDRNLQAQGAAMLRDVMKELSNQDENE